MKYQPIVYEPRGAAAEYAEKACNLRMSCRHGCTYCYCPAVCHMSRDAFMAGGPPKAHALERLNRDCRRMIERGDTRRLFISFVGDLCDGQDDGFSRAVLEMLCYEGQPVSLLTKGGTRATLAFPFMPWGDHFGTSLIWSDDRLREQYEPNAASVEDRLEAVSHASARGYHCWASVEPVIEPAQALLAMAKLADYGCREVRLGRRRGDNSQDWSAFCAESERIVSDYGLRYQVKASLAEFWPEGLPLDNRGGQQ